MKKSIFKKYILFFFIIIILSFTILAVIVSSTIVQSISTERRHSSSNIGISLSMYLEKQLNGTSTSSSTLNQYISSNLFDVNAMLNMFSTGINDNQILIIIVDSKGQILTSTNGTYIGNISEMEAYNHISDERQYVYTGPILNETNGTFNITVTPIRLRENSCGAVLTCYTSVWISELSYDMLRAILITILWVLVASFIAFYVFSERISAPIKEISDATKNFAKGNFKTRLKAEGDDEISDLAQAFNSMAESLDNLESMRSSFLANVSHDLRTPMTTISGFIDGIISGAIPEDKQPYYLGIIQQEIKRLSRIVSDLLEISRLEAGSKKYEITTFDIVEMSRIILLTFENKIDLKKLDIEFNAPDEEVLIDSDRDCIYRIVYNIFDNAVKFSNDGGKFKVDITIDKENVVLSVYNEGIGIPKEDMKHIFERFYKTDKSRGLDKTGSGLGLYIAKSMLDNLDGSISAKSEYGKNCEFTIKLKKSKGQG